MESMLASKEKGEKVIEAFFESTPNILKMNDMEIYNAAVQVTGYSPIYTEVAMYLLDYVSILRRIYSDKTALKSLKYFKEYERKPDEVYKYTVQREEATNG